MIGLTRPVRSCVHGRDAPDGLFRLPSMGQSRDPLEVASRTIGKAKAQAASHSLLRIESSK